MSLTATKWVLEQKNVPLATRAVLFVIADMVNRDGKAWPSTSSLADKCEITKRMLIRHISKAAELGVLNIAKSSGRGSIYSFPLVNNMTPVTDSSPVNNSGHSGEQYVTTLTVKNRKRTVNNIEQREAEEKNDSPRLIPDEHPEWFETLLRIEAGKGETPVGPGDLESLQKWAKEKSHTESNLEDTALYIESAWTGQLKKRTNVRATFQNLVNRGYSSGTVNQRPQYDMAGGQRNGRKPGGRAGRGIKQHPSGDFTEDIAAFAAQDATREAARGDVNG